jgi:hypothetical protein
MNKIVLVALPFSALILACTQPPSGPTEPAGCETITIPACTGSGTNPKININLTASKLIVAPKNVCAKPGTPVTVTITPAISTETVATVPKVPTNKWMYGINYPIAEGFTLPVPDEAEVGEHFDYLIVTGGGKCIDPRIEIN